jgi:hypothetical protein
MQTERILINADSITTNSDAGLINKLLSLQMPENNVTVTSGIRPG